MSKKRELIQIILTQLNTELELILLSAKAARQAATHEESKAEDSHDTRGLEASYLAGAQMARALALKKTIAAYPFMNVQELKAGDSIKVGALIEVENTGKKFHYFLVSQGGGMAVTFEDRTVQVITSAAPLGEALLGRKVGDVVEIEGQRVPREFKITAIV